MSELPDGVELVDLDPFDDDTLVAWHAAYADAAVAAVPGHAHPMTCEEIRLIMQEPSRARTSIGVALRVDGVVVGCGYVGLPKLDNLNSAMVDAAISPPYQGRGLGSLLVARLEQIASEHGRVLLNGQLSWPFDGGPTGVGSPGAAFAQRHGYQLALGDVKRELALPVSTEVLDRLSAETATRHEGYDVRAWVGRVPDEFVERWVTLASSLNTEAPTGDMEIEPTKPDVAAFREMEELEVRQRRTRYRAMALAPDGDLVAYSDFTVAAHDPGMVYQQGTLVRHDHRGHRLGVAVKLANLRQLPLTSDGVRLTCVVTWNAESNAHMIAVNEQLGFVPVARGGEVQKRLRP